MTFAERRSRWHVLAAATLAAALLSLALDDPTRAGSVTPCGNSSPQCDGACPSGEVCNGISRGNATECVCRAVGCCQLANGTCSDNVTALTCLGGGIAFVANGTCGVDCLAQTPTATASATPTQTPAPNGGSCADPADCVSGNCVDDVCCDTACTGPQQTCPQGVCTDIAPAPAASRNGLLLSVLVLSGIAAAALLRRRVR